MSKLIFCTFLFFAFNFTRSNSENAMAIREELSLYDHTDDSLTRYADSLCKLKMDYFVQQFGSVESLEKFYGVTLDSLYRYCREIHLDSLKKISGN